MHEINIPIKQAGFHAEIYHGYPREPYLKVFFLFQGPSSSVPMSNFPSLYLNKWVEWGPSVQMNHHLIANSHRLKGPREW